ncbi:hypothetical protein [Geomonas anaerohicana]|uniref:Uncharacterized protein n=1 Tax=Geomonas anaerohicana TaxID=2798583 RepID=A0ABS0YD77_9BACT|nr:hypothetical protein [Geomonas anaerohicana]MBJ6749882.1 hypothetical protein [Geomonas anaerohicana]
MAKKYQAPHFLHEKVTHETYERWLRRKAQAHLKRDRLRGNTTATGETYRVAIHEAVEASGGLDAYTGEALDWSLISQYDNDKSQAQRRAYKKGFALLPTVDHVGDGTGAADFRICGWRTNDLKNDLAFDELLEVCRSVLEHHGYIVQDSAE